MCLSPGGVFHVILCVAIKKCFLVAFLVECIFLFPVWPFLVASHLNTSQVQSYLVILREDAKRENICIDSWRWHPYFKLFHNSFFIFCTSNSGYNIFYSRADRTQSWVRGHGETKWGIQLLQLCSGTQDCFTSYRQA